MRRDTVSVFGYRYGLDILRLKIVSYGMNDELESKKDQQRKLYDREFERGIRENILANRFVVTICTPSVESSMTFYIYRN